MFVVFRVFSLGQVVLYIVFMAFPLPQTLVKTLAKSLARNIAKNPTKNLAKKGFRRFKGVIVLDAFAVFRCFKLFFP